MSTRHKFFFGLFSSKSADDSDAGDDDGGANGNVTVLVIVLTIVSVESMVTVVMLLKHGMGALHIGLETVGSLWKAIKTFLRMCAQCTLLSLDQQYNCLMH